MPLYAIWKDILEWNIAKEGGQDLLGFIDYLKKTKQENIVRRKDMFNTQFYYLKTLRYCLNRAV